MAVPTWVTEAGVLGTWVIGVLALFGDRIRAMVFKPKLHLKLKSNVGDRNTQDVEENGIKRKREVRYYHLAVTNQAKYPKAEDVQVLLLGVERTDKVEERKPGDYTFRCRSVGPTDCIRSCDQWARRQRALLICFSFAKTC